MNKIKKGDSVIVISGKDKGKKGEVIRSYLNIISVWYQQSTWQKNIQNQILMLV